MGQNLGDTLQLGVHEINRRGPRVSNGTNGRTILDQENPKIRNNIQIFDWVAQFDNGKPIKAANFGRRKEDEENRRIL